MPTDPIRNEHETDDARDAGVSGGPESADAGAFAPIDADGGLIFATRLPGRASDFPTERSEAVAAGGWSAADRAEGGGAVWAHLDRTKARAQRWVRESGGVPSVVAEALLAEETRPRAVERGDGLLVILRGVNLQPGAEPDELIVIRMWIEPTRAITLRQYRFAAIGRLRESASSGRGPGTPGALLVAIADGLSAGLGPVVENLQSLLDETENALAEEDPRGLDTRGLAAVRRQSIRLRRYLAPQRDALLSLASSPSPLLGPHQRAEMQELAQRTARFVEDLEEVRDRAAVSQEELRAARERQASRTMYLLTLVAAIALPLGLVTGLLGINVGGMPGADDPSAFWWVAGGMLVVAVGLAALFKSLRWL
jgi:zinc transporter